MVDHMAKCSSDVAVNDECKLRFLELRAKKNHQFIVFKVEEKSQQVIVEKLGKPDESYGDFTASLPANECRFAVYDFGFKTDEKCQNRKIFFIAWSPDSSTATNKMLYASSKDKLKRELDGIQVEFTKAEKSVAALREQEQENSKLKRELNEVKREVSESRKQASNFEELSNERSTAFEEEKQQSCKLSQTMQQKEAEMKEEKGKIYREGVDLSKEQINDTRKMSWSEGYRQGYSAASGKPTKEVEVPPAPITHDPTIPQDVLTIK